MDSIVSFIVYMNSLSYLEDLNKVPSSLANRNLFWADRLAATRFLTDRPIAMQWPKYTRFV